MASELKPLDTQNVIIGPFTDGLIQSEIVSHYSAPAGSLSYVENLTTDTIGQLTSRPKLQLSRAVEPNTAGAKSIYIYEVNGSAVYLFDQNGTQTKISDPETGIISSTIASGFSTIIRYDTIQGVLLYVQSGDAFIRTVSGTTPSTVIATFPTTTNLISAGYVGRIWGAGDKDATSRLYYTNVINIADVLLTTGGTQFIRINARDGDTITALLRGQKALYAFTQNGIFRVYDTTSVDNAPFSNIGTYTQEQIVKGKDAYYFYHPSGIYRMEEGGYPEEISRPIYSLIQNVANQYAVVGWADNDSIYYNLGATFWDKPNTKSLVVKYQISTGKWSMLSYWGINILAATSKNPSFDFTSTGTPTQSDYYPLAYVSGQIISDTKYFVALPTRLHRSTNIFITDLENFDAYSYPVFTSLETQWVTFGLEHILKSINGLTISSERGNNLKLYVLYDNESNEWQEIGEIKDKYITIFRNWSSEQFNRVKFKVAGDGVGGPLKIGILTALKVDYHGYSEN